MLFCSASYVYVLSETHTITCRLAVGDHPNTVGKCVGDFNIVRCRLLGKALPLFEGCVLVDKT